ncbi:MAG: DUF3617 family protein [Candidatus Acidiferrales bacterium]
MQRSVLFGLLFLWCGFLGGTDKIQPLDIKLGLWEATNNSQVTGALPIPPEVLARMTPEQRAKFEEAMKARASQGPTARTYKSCITKEKINDQHVFDEGRKSCIRTVVTSTSSELEMHMECMDAGTKRRGTFRIEAINSENVKGSVQMVSSSNDRTMNINSNFTAKWISPDCGDTK